MLYSETPIDDNHTRRFNILTSVPIIIVWWTSCQQDAFIQDLEYALTHQWCNITRKVSGHFGTSEK